MKYDIDELLKETFKSKESQGEIRPSNILNQETISKMREINDMKKSRFSNFSVLTKVAVGLACAGIVVSASTVAYSAITKSKGFDYKIEMDDGITVEFTSTIQYKILPQDKLSKVDEGNITMQWNELEDMLGFSLLGGGQQDNGNVYYSTCLNENDSVAVVDLWIPTYKGYGESTSIDGYIYYDRMINMSISILDVNAESGYVEPFMEGKDAAGGKEFIEKYYVKSLGTEAVFYHTDNDEGYVTAVFGYDGAYYTLQGMDVTVEEMKEVIDSMK